MRAGMVAIGVLVCVAVAACGSDDDLDPETIANAAEATIESGGMYAVADYEAREGDLRYGFEIKGYEDVDAGLGDYRIASHGLGEPGSSDNVDSRVIKHGSVAFILDPAVSKFLRKLGLRRTWLQVVYNDISTFAEGQLRDAAYIGLQSPARLLHYAKAARTESRGDGLTIEGAKTTRYSGTVNLDEVRERAAGDERGPLRRDVELMRGDTDLETVPIEVWIDGDGMVRQIRMRHDAKTGVDEREVVLSDFGRKVDPMTVSSFDYAGVEEVAEKLRGRGG
jgi:hypothetical protein